jgi:hypothetical protein
MSVFKDFRLTTYVHVCRLLGAALVAIASACYARSLQLLRTSVPVPDFRPHSPRSRSNGDTCVLVDRQLVALARERSFLLQQ